MRLLKNSLLPLLCLFLFTGAISCTKSKEVEREQSVTISRSALTLLPGQSKLILPNFGAGVKPERTYTWTSANTAVAEVISLPDLSAEITANGPGTTEITLASTDGEVSAKCQVIVQDHPDDGVLKILAIGNSFSEDALESYLHDLIKADGVSVVIGNASIGSASLSLHVQNAQNNAAAYSYRKIGQSGVKTTAENTTLATALADENWDYISMQQVSSESGRYETYQSSLPLLFSYVKSKATNPKVKYGLHQTWAYAQNSTHPGFANYNNDQMAMYQAIVDAIGRAKSLADIAVVVPAGTAIQNGRTSYIGDNFCRDGYHLDLNIGRYAAACAWYEAITGNNVVGNPFKPATLSDYEAALAQNAAHLAVLKPNEVSVLESYQQPENGGALFSKPIYIAFGAGTSVPGWNRLSGALAGTTLNNVKDSDGNTTPVGLTVTERFNADNTSGEGTTTTDFNMPSSVSTVNFYGNSKASFGGLLVTQSTLRITGLDKTKKYTLCYYGSRSGVTDNRETAYIAKGKNEAKAYLNASKNTSSIACTENVEPTDDGEITVTITAGPNNNNSTGFYYIAAMRISPGI